MHRVRPLADDRHFPRCTIGAALSGLSISSIASGWTFWQRNLKAALHLPHGKAEHGGATIFHKVDIYFADAEAGRTAITVRSILAVGAVATGWGGVGLEMRRHDARESERHSCLHLFVRYGRSVCSVLAVAAVNTVLTWLAILQLGKAGHHLALQIGDGQDPSIEFSQARAMLGITKLPLPLRVPLDGRYGACDRISRSVSEAG
ncbi:hypothetical protein D8676_25300 [Mesorhizobium sp. YM1C-6-2]|nr:hypothetical protein D8676_25300 [Mesorhizobium sp. YM1C-6-2]